MLIPSTIRWLFKKKKKANIFNETSIKNITKNRKVTHKRKENKIELQWWTKGGTAARDKS